MQDEHFQSFNLVMNHMFKNVRKLISMYTNLQCHKNTWILLTHDCALSTFIQGLINPNWSRGFQNNLSRGGVIITPPPKIQHFNGHTKPIKYVLIILKRILSFNLLLHFYKYWFCIISLSLDGYIFTIFLQFWNLPLYHTYHDTILFMTLQNCECCLNLLQFWMKRIPGYFNELRECECISSL